MQDTETEDDADDVLGMLDRGNGAADDRRTVAILTDTERAEFLAVVNRTMADAFGTLFHWYGQWLKFCRAKHEQTGKEKWEKAASRWRDRLVWLERQLILTGSEEGLRARQIVEAIKGRGAEEEPEGLSVHVNPGQEGDDDGGGGFFS